jgi:hypothetical protein
LQSGFLFLKLLGLTFFLFQRGLELGFFLEKGVHLGLQPQHAFAGRVVRGLVLFGIPVATALQSKQHPGAQNDDQPHA